MFSHKNTSEATSRSLSHDPSALPSVPILRSSSAIPEETRRVHWWNSETERVNADLVTSPYHPPSSGIFAPSMTSITFPGHSLSWTNGVLFRSFAEAMEEIPSSAVNLNNGNEATARPLKRVLTINRDVGDAMRKRRRIEKRWPRGRMLKGLGLLFNPRGVAMSKMDQKELVAKVARETRALAVARELTAKATGEKQ